MVEQLINIKGVRDGLNIYFNTKSASFKDICYALEKLLLEKNGFLKDATYFLYPETPFTNGEREIIDEILYKYHLKKGPEQLVKKEQLNTNEEPKTINAPRGGDSVLINKNLRSGQRININGNAILVGDINTGAELIASGSIVVMGTARGILHAGKEGDHDAFILAYDFSCQQVRIADVISVFNNDISLKGPQKAVLDDGKITVYPYEATALKAVLHS